MKFLLVLAGLLASTPLIAQSEFRFSDGGSRQTYLLSASEVYARRAPGVEIEKTQSWDSYGSVYTLKAGVSRLRRDRSGAPTKSGSDAVVVHPVFYDRRELPAPERLASMKPAERAARLAAATRPMSNKLLVRMDASRWEALAAGGAVKREESLLKGWMLISYPDPLSALDAVERMTREGGWEFTPVFLRKFEKRQVLQREVNDPLYPKQWHLSATEEPNIKIGNAWDSVTGKGINIAVVDDGLEVAHEDLSTSAYPLTSGYHRNFNEGPENDPSPLKTTETHGTACAGLAAATGFNSLGVVGVAPEARMMGLRLIAGASAEDANGTALAWQPEGTTVHVSSNSWGPEDDGKNSGRVSAIQLAGIEKGATQNRGGLGTVYAISCGNGRGSGDDASYDAFSASRFGIAVGAVNRKGEPSSFSEAGMSVAVVAPGGEFQPPEVLWTTNNSGDKPLAEKNEKFPTSEAPVNYTDAFNGTSSAAPQVSGAIALILEKNPALGYRDVKEILMKTARKDVLKEGEPFKENTGGFSFSRSFGAGLLNVHGALELATGWTNLGPLVMAETTVSTPTAIPDANELVTIPLDLSAANKIRVEHVEFIINVKHAKRGMLSFGIQSPGGMLSEARPRPNDDNADFTDYMFTSVHHWGEVSSGVWKFLALDGAADGVAGEVTSVTIKVYGTVAQ
jgi:kexin